MSVKIEGLVSDELNNSAIIVVIQRNAGDRIVRALSSVYRQDYDDIGILFIDDASTDHTRELAINYFEQNTKRGFDIALHLNEKKTPKILSLDTATRKYCKNPNSVLFWLDGDDELLTTEAIRVMMNDHQQYDIVWSQHEFVNLKTNRTSPGYGGVLESDFPRQHPWVSSHLTSFKNHLFQSLPNHLLRDEDGTYYPFAIDRVVMYPLIEMVGKEKCFFRDKMYYRYYHATPEHIRRIQKACLKKLLQQKPLRTITDL